MQALGLVWQNSSAADVEEVHQEIPEPAQFGARLLLDHWNGNADGITVGRDLPSRKLACVLRNVALLEPRDGMADFHIRLAGTAFMRRFGRDVSGLKLSEVYDREHFEAHRARYARVIASRRPHVADVELRRNRRTFSRVESVCLPIWPPHRQESWILKGLFYSDWA